MESTDQKQQPVQEQSKDQIDPDDALFLKRHDLPVDVLEMECQPLAT